MKPFVRVGMGYDVHRLDFGRKLILGGVEFDYEKGLTGHSDADVLVHAIMDAILGALGRGDIGKLFSDQDPKYEGADSLKLLKIIGDNLAPEGYEVGNIDSTLIMERPKVSDYTHKMEENIARALGIDKHQVNVKATTEEKLGFTGKGEGIAAQAVCLLFKKEEVFL